MRTVTYEGVNVATGNWRRNQSVLDYDGSGGKNRTEGYSSFADEMSPEDAARYMKFLENGSSEGLKDAEMLAIGKVDEFLALEKIDYRDIWNIRNSSRIGEGGTAVKYSPVNSGPLSEDVANSFNGATYTERVLTEDTV